MSFATDGTRDARRSGIQEVSRVFVSVDVVLQALSRSFQVSFTTTEKVRIVSLRLSDADGRELGHGEIAADVGHGQDASAYAAQARSLAEALCSNPPGDPDELTAALSVADVFPPVKMLVEMAFLDHLARRAGLPVWRLLGLPEPGVVRLMTTVPIGEELPAEGPLKIKLGSDRDAEVLRGLVGVPDPVVLDVNGGWKAEDWRRLCPLVREVRPAVLEDPVADLGLLAEVRAALPETALVLDEPVHDQASIEYAATEAGGANVKLMRVGGIAAARKGIDSLTAAGATRMLGCFLEPPRAIAYAAQLAGYCEWTDLDGHFWLSDEPAVTEYRLDSGSPGIPRIVS